VAIVAVLAELVEIKLFNYECPIKIVGYYSKSRPWNLEV